MTMPRALLAMLLFLTAPAPAADDKPADGPEKKPANPRVVFEIALGDEKWGDITLELEPDKAPLTVDNFLTYVDEGYFDGTIFHRVMSNFMIQGGGFTSLTQEKSKGQHPPIQNEAKNGLKNLEGTIAMARTRAPHSATSQFFINVKNNDMLDYPSFDNWGYAVFGKVVEGMDVVNKIKSIEVRARGPEMSEPVNPPKIARAYKVGGPRKRVLILCKSNAGRSQMAVGLWRKFGVSDWEVHSAGLEPAPKVSPQAVEVMKEAGVDISAAKPQKLDKFVDQKFDLVVTVCAETDKACPEFKNAKAREHWDTPNPSAAEGGDDEKLDAYRKVRDGLAERIRKYIAEHSGKPARP